MRREQLRAIAERIVRVARRVRRSVVALHLPGPITIRPAMASDVSFLRQRALDAGFPPPPWRPSNRVALRAPHVARMVDGWQREGDIGVIGLHGRRAVAAAWCRRFDESEIVSRWADPKVPELAIAVVDGFRGKGRGQRVLEALLSEARDAGYQAIDLQVGERNTQALALYRRVGFEPVGSPEGDLIWMRCSLVHSTGDPIPIGERAGADFARSPGR